MKYNVFALVLLAILFTAQPSIAENKTFQCIENKKKPERQIIGLQLLHAEDASAWKDVQELNVDWLRVEIHWGLIEHNQGDFNWKLTDDVIHYSKLSNKKILLLVNNIPKWVKVNENPELYYARFLVKFFERYTADDLKNIHAFEVFNEPNNRDQGWLVGEVSLKDSAKMFAQFLIVSNVVIRKHLPQVFLVSGGLMQDGHNPSNYMAEALMYDIAPCFDIFGYHPYGHDDQLFSAQESIEDSLRRSGLSDKPVWFTEYGTTNNKDRKNRLNSTFKEAKDLNAIFWFLHQDFGVINNTYGLIDFFGKRKPDFFLFKNLVKQHQSIASKANK